MTKTFDSLPVYQLYALRQNDEIREYDSVTKKYVVTPIEEIIMNELVVVTDKASYLAYSAAWKLEYNKLSDDIRLIKRFRKLKNREAASKEEKDYFLTLPSHGRLKVDAYFMLETRLTSKALARRFYLETRHLTT